MLSEEGVEETHVCRYLVALSRGFGWPDGHAGGLGWGAG